MRFTAFLAAAFFAFVQLPPSGTLSPSDEPLFRAEVRRVEAQLSASPGNCWVMNELARTWAAGQQYPETVQWLERIADLRSGLDPSRDPLYRPLRGTREFEAILQKTRESNGPVSSGREAFRIGEGDLVPESEAYDPAEKRFYFGSMRKGTVVSCDMAGRCSPFASGLGSVLGVKFGAGRLWAIANEGKESALIEFGLGGQRKYIAQGTGSRLNDIAVAPSGDVFVTDTAAGAVQVLHRGGERLEPFLPAVRFQFANGIAVSPSGRLLYVSNYPDGISVVELRNRSVRPLAAPGGVCLALVDGLYSWRQSLIAVQNGSMNPRVVRFDLSADGLKIQKMQVLERGNPLFEGITGGTIAGDEFYFAANIQDEKPAGSKFDPIRILKIPLR
jgi:hypothetical protein